MPLYKYQCLACAGLDKRIAGLDDHTAFCVQCGGVMLRREEDIFRLFCAGDDPIPAPGASLEA